jgi:transcription elongation factor GreA
MRISKLETTIANARLIDDSSIDKSRAFILSTVRIRNKANQMETQYTLVAESEANLKEKKISVDSPIGKGLLGKKVGEVAEINTPGGLMHLEILEITR